MGAEDLAYKMLKGCPRERISAEDALLHKFFSTLPCQLYQLSDGMFNAHPCVIFIDQMPELYAWLLLFIGKKSGFGHSLHIRGNLYSYKCI